MPTSRGSLLRRFWIDCDADGDVPAAGYGATVYDIEDALALVQETVFHGQPVPPVLAIMHDVEIAMLGRGVKVSALSSRRRGVWWPPSEDGQPR